MTYQPATPLGGFAGWAFLSRTRIAQQEAFDSSAIIQRNTTYFAENIADISSAEELVADRRLLQVALGAFGLGDDINNKYFLQKILEDGTLNDQALANRLSDKRYFEFAEAFGFGDFSTPRTVLSDFPEEINDRYKTQQFEIAVGNQNADMRLALSLERSLETITTTDTTNDGRWFLVMGQPPVREVFEAALGLPGSIGALDLDLQLKSFRDAANARFGDGEVTQFAEPEKRETLIRLFLLQSEITSGGNNSLGASTALTLLQNVASNQKLF